MAVYRFGVCFDVIQFDSETGDVQRSGRSTRLRPQPARVLEHLLQRQGRLVTREELQRVVWPDGRFVHFDHGLNSCMKQVRAALGERGPAGNLIETLVKRGFRFVAPVTLATGQLTQEAAR